MKNFSVPSTLIILATALAMGMSAPSGLQVSEVLGAFKEKGLLAVAFGATKIRCVTHLDVNREDCTDAIKILHEVFES